MLRLATVAVVAMGVVGALLAGNRAYPTHQTDYGRATKVRSMAKAIFGAGCFWGVEAAFRKVPGVVSTTVGYTGGSSPNPIYEQVCSGRTGHTESVLVNYDVEKVTYEELLRIFWRIHDPTEKHKAQYESVIFYDTAQQKAAAEAALTHLQRSGAVRGQIVTEILPAKQFYPAEEYHQQYYEKHGITGDVCAR